MKTEHKMTRIRKGTGEGGYIKPVCTCGWEGDCHYGYDDYQHTNLQRQENKHRKENLDN